MNIDTSNGVYSVLLNLIAGYYLYLLQILNSRATKKAVTNTSKNLKLYFGNH